MKISYRHVSHICSHKTGELASLSCSPWIACVQHKLCMAINTENSCEQRKWEAEKNRCRAICTYYVVSNCTHNVTLDALLCLPTCRKKLKQQPWPAQACGKCSHSACTLYWLMYRPQMGLTDFFLSAIGIIFSAWINNIWQQKNFIASLLKVIGNLGVLLIWNRKESERSEK